MAKIFIFIALVVFSSEIFGMRLTKRQASDQATNANESLTRTVGLESCLRRCPVTSEYSPICGTDNVTYDNPGRLGCAQNCGVDVQHMRKGRCNVPIISTPPAQPN